MADDTELNPGTGGDIVATDDILGVKFQRVKMTLGADGVTDGDVSQTNPMPTDLAEVGGAATKVGPGTSAGALRVELPTDGQGRVIPTWDPVTISQSGTKTLPFTGVSTEIVPANAKRKSVLLYNDGNFDVRVKNGSAADPTTQKLLAGGFLVFEAIHAVNGLNPLANGEDVDVIWTDEGYG